MENSARNDDPDRKDHESTVDKDSHWLIAEHAFAIIGAAAALIAVVGAIVVGVEHTPTFELHREEGMVSNLIPGDDYGKMTALIGAQPDFHESLHSGRQLYVFDRRWEYIQLLVDETGTVLSVGVYAKTTKFKVTLATGTVVNGASVGQQLGGDPVGAYGACGAPWYLYFESYTFPGAGGFRSEIIGDLPVTDTDNLTASGAPCGLFFSYAPCITSYERTFSTSSPTLSSKLVACIDSLKNGRATLANMLPSIVIVTAPYQPILPDMLNEDYFYKLAKV